MSCANRRLPYQRYSTTPLRWAIHLWVAAAGSHRVLMAHAAHVNELWKDMVALGIYDSVLCNALDLA
ncbi:hypothetical protein B0H13DRAFT_2309885 [Mycena leptocephala]|nr:hypothetical protein B0H13DRAFT_2309885 [Mycena leptocephala]